MVAMGQHDVFILTKLDVAVGICVTLYLAFPWSDAGKVSRQRHGPAIQGPGGDDAPAAMGDNHGPKPPHAEAPQCPGRCRGVAHLQCADGG